MSRQYRGADLAAEMLRLRSLPLESADLVHPTTPGGQSRREHVACTRCRGTRTYNVCARCSRCCDCPDRPKDGQR